MDKGSRSDLNSKDQAELLLEELRSRKLSFNQFEQLFLGYITSDIEMAGRLAEGLKRKKLPLDPDEQALKLRLIGRFHEACSNHKLAIQWTTRALASFSSVASAGRHQCLRQLFSSYAHLGRYDRANYFADQALADPQLSNAERVKIHANLGGLAYRLHDYATALEQYTRALQFLEDASAQNQAVLLYNLGLLYLSLNKFAEAEENFAEASQLFRKFRQNIYHAHTLQSFGLLYTILGQYYQAETKLKEAREAYLAGGDSTGATLCDLELIRLDTRLNRYDRVLERLPALLDAFRKQGRYPELALIFYNGVVPAIAVREYALAAEYLRRASRIFRKERNRHYEANCRMLEGVLLWHEGRHKSGLAKIQEARLAFAQTGISELEMACLIYAHRIRSKADDEFGFRRVRTLLKQPLSPTMRSQGLVLLSDYWQQRGQIKRSVGNLFEAANIVEESRATITNQALRTSFFEDKTELYELLIERLLEWKNPAASSQVFRAMELSRSRQMMEVLSRREALPPVINRNDPLLLALHRLDLRIKQLNRKLEHLATDAESSKVERATLVGSIAETRAAIIRVRKSMRHEKRLSLFYPLEFRPEDIRQHLQPGQLLVLYYLGKKTIYRIELDGESLRTYQHPLPESFLRDFNLMINILANRIEPKMSRALALADQFSQILMPEQLDRCQHVTFIMHKALQRFPLALLRCRDGRLLLETHTINQCPNLPVFYFTQREHTSIRTKPVFCFSNCEDDPKAPERDFLMRKYPNAVVIEKLDDPNLEDALRHSDFIHFAGHCVFDRRNPDNSFLQLGGARISLAHFAMLGFEARPFINLAACQSGWMALSAGNEHHGFVIGSFAAGANSLLAGLWEVDDVATGAWMDIFYAHLDRGLAQAYRQACLVMRDRDANPYLWAAFSLLGQT